MPGVADRARKSVGHETTFATDVDDPEVIRYLEAENEYAAAVMRPTEALQKQLYDETIPEDVLIGYHLCYGTWGGWPMTEVDDLSLCVRLSNEPAWTCFACRSAPACSATICRRRRRPSKSSCTCMRAGVNASAVSSFSR